MKKDSNSKRQVLRLLELLKDGDLRSIAKILEQNAEIESTLEGIQIREIVQKFTNYIESLNSILNEDSQKNIPHFGINDEVGESISNAIVEVKRSSRQAKKIKKALEIERSKLVQEEWLKSQCASIYSKIQTSRTLQELGKLVLGEIAFSIGAQVGVFYVKKTLSKATDLSSLNNQKLILAATYGIQVEAVKEEFDIGEGILGQSAADLKIRRLEKIPEDFIKIESGLGSSPPKSILLIPIAHENDLCGVIEIATLWEISEIQMRLLVQIADSLGVVIKSITDKIIREELLNEIAKTNSMLIAQKQALDFSAIVAETDLRGKITYINEKFLEISKYSRDELMGQDHRILNSGYHSKEFFVHLWKTIASGNVWHGEVRNRANDGTEYWVDTTIYPARNVAGKVEKYVAIRFDITEKKRAFEELQVATTSAKNLAKVKSEFLANMSHEIRTPMNAIVGMAELLAETPLNVDQDHYVRILRNSSEALLDVINNILDLSKIESGNIVLESIPFDLEDLIHTTSEIMGRAAHKKGLEFVVSIQDGINIMVIGDSNKLRQVLINLLSNAIKFTKTGYVLLKVEKCADSTGALRFSVKDTGIGIEKDSLSLIFKNFSQANSSTTRVYGGTGLGLAISKRIIEAMGGKISLESEVGVGSTFSFVLALNEQRLSQAQGNANEEIFLNKRALIIENSQEARTSLKEALEGKGIKVVEASTSGDGIRIANSSRDSQEYFDFIFINYGMNLMNGIEIAKQISHPSSFCTPIVVVTFGAHEKRSEMGCASNVGVSFFIAKPFKYSELFSCLASAYRRRNVIPKVLVVDDENEIRDLIVESLKKLRVTCFEATNGKSALEILKQYKDIDVVVSDIKMPEMDGIQLLQETRSERIDSSFVFLSAFMPKVSEATSALLADVEVLAKPYFESDLLNVVSRHIERRITGQKVKMNKIVVESTFNPFKVLIVEDVRENVDLIKIYLSKLPYTLDFAFNGAEALEQFTTSKYDLILMDIQMPILDGFETIQQVRKWEKDRKLDATPIVALSAHALSEEIERVKSVGAIDYLTKPIKKQALIDAIEKYAKKNPEQLKVKLVA